MFIPIAFQAAILLLACFAAYVLFCTLRRLATQTPRRTLKSLRSFGYRPISLFIGLRYTRAKQKNHFISFISLSSMLGIALGVTVLITVLSVMNGFDTHIRARVFSMARQITITQYDGPFSDWQAQIPTLQSHREIIGIAPFIVGQGMLTRNGIVQSVMINGIDPKQEAKVNELVKKMQSGSLSKLQDGHFGIVLGEVLAQSLSVRVGDKLLLMTPEAAITPIGMIPRLKRFQVVGIFRMGQGFGFDSHYAFISLGDAQKLYHLGKRITGLQLKLTDLYQAPKLAKILSDTLPNRYIIDNWTQDYGHFFQAIALEKTMMFIILIFIIAVAAFNLVSSLVMLVTDKQSDIAILRTFGASPALILRVFMIQGTIIGCIGTLLGLIGGITLSLHLTKWVNQLQDLFDIQLLQSDVYYVNYLPTQLQFTDVFHVCLITIVLCLLATLYPAFKAARTEPAEALRYE